MKWSTIKTIAMLALAALILWYIGGSMELLAGLGLGGWLERERNRGESGGTSSDTDPPDRPPAKEAETSSTVDEAAKEHAEKVKTPEADSPAELFEQQAEEL